MYILLFVLLMAPFGAIGSNSNSNNNSTTSPITTGISTNSNSNNHHQHHYPITDTNQNTQPTTSLSPIGALSLSSTTTASTTIATSTVNNRYSDLVVCERNINIRNDLTKISKELENCDIVDGYVTLALISQSYNGQLIQPQDWDNITFPRLREITQHLILFRVQHLTSLHRLFPNLSVIRGDSVMHSYSLVIYEMMHLQEINLPNLNDILTGSVRIERNPNLCFFDTINWDRICKKRFAPHFIKDNKRECTASCPTTCRSWPGDAAAMDPIEGAVQQRRLLERFCFNAHNCQDPNMECAQSSHLPPATDGSGCCSAQCAGGCYEGNRSDRCFSCRNVLQRGKCVENCDKNLFLYKGTCLTTQECVAKRVTVVPDNSCDKEPSIQDNFKAISIPGETGQCQTKCPPNFEEDRSHKDKCKPCENNKCKIVCKIDSPITHLSTLEKIIGDRCNVINGTLDISLKRGKNVNEKLREAFRDVQEITDYLRITRSPSIVSLDFFENLRYIRGANVNLGRYALVILENPSLQDLFPSFGKRGVQLEIGNGTVFAHLNPRLCPHKIDELKNYTKVAPWDEKDVSQHSNGEKEACQNDRLDVMYQFSTPTLTFLRFANYGKSMDDPRQLLYYIIFYREAKEGNVSMYDGKDACGRNDVWVNTQEQPNPKNKEDYLVTSIKTKPATRYALYVRTFTVQSSQGAISSIIYFETVPDTPGMPRDVSANPRSPNNITISWMQPTKPNGRIDHYLIRITKLEQDPALDVDDICRKDGMDYVTQQITKDEPLKMSNFLPNSDQQSNNSSLNSASSDTGASSGTCDCSGTSDDDEGELRVEQVTFQDAMINMLYLRQCPDSSAVSSSTTTASSTVEHRVRRSVSSMNSIDTNGGLPSSSSSAISRSDPSRTSIDQTESTGAGASGSSSQISNSKPSSSNSGNNQGLNQEIEFNPLDRTMDLIVQPRASLRLSGTEFIHVVTLEHYTSYSIEIQACHDGSFKPTTKGYQQCGLAGVAYVRTLPSARADLIDPQSIRFDSATNVSSENAIPAISWAWPTTPNGQILGARIYLTGESSQQLSNCITKTAFDAADYHYTPDGLAPGKYTVKIVVVTSAGAGIGTEAVEILIVPSQRPALVYYVAIVGVLIILITVMVASYFIVDYKRKKLEGLLYASVNPDYISYTPDEWEVDKDKLTVLKKIGNGSFGTVHKGELKRDNIVIPCAVKTISSDSTARQRIDFLNEASTMKKFDTHHVVKLLGVVSTSSPTYVIMELMERGDLKSFMLSIRPEYEKKKKTLYDRIYPTAAQIADGMAYLASHKFVHRDLAARNCMVAEDYTVKIGDFGLTRDIYENDYYRRGNQARLPVRWMSPEALRDNLYTTASDVWSYGIVIWEMATLCQYPYSGLINEEVCTYVKSGRTITRPTNCPDKLLQIMNRCFRFKPEERPSFMDIIEFLMPDTNNELSSHSYYYQVRNDEGLALLSTTTTTNNTRQSSPDESTATRGAESYPLLPWPSPSPHVNGDIPPNGPALCLQMGS